MEKDKASWLTASLKNKIRQIFEPRYACVLDDALTEEIALNLIEVLETIFKFKWKIQNGNNNFIASKK